MLLALKLPPAGELCLDRGCDMLVGNDLDCDTDMGLDRVVSDGDDAKYSAASAAGSTSTEDTQTRGRD